MSRSPDTAWLTARPIAHRGLHDGNRTVFENSMTAFQRAIDGGFSIECDLHLSRDRTPMVFHDATLERLTGDPREVADLSAAELGALRLGETADGIPTFAELLALVGGRVPIVAELKGADPAADHDVIDQLRPLVDGYAGPLALMSFDEWLVRDAIAAFGARIPIGLTAEGETEEALQRHSVLFASGCAFTSYNVHHLPNAFTTHVRDERALPVVSWTVRTPDELSRSERHADQMTFEGFMPGA